MEEGGKGCKDYVRRASEGERGVRIIRKETVRGCEKGERGVKRCAALV